MTSIRHFEPADVEFALQQKAREGWAVSRAQFEVYPKHDPDGCFVATEGRRPVGMVTTACFGASGWIGNLIVEPDFRSRGIGRALMECGLDSLRNRGAATVHLEGDPPGIPLYRKLGFVDEFESCRFTLPRSITRPALDGSAADTMTSEDLDDVAALDAAITGAGRRRFLELKIPRADLATVRRRNGKIVSFLLAASTDRGLRIGPCIAQDHDDARGLIAAAVSAAAGRPVLIGLPAVNTETIGMLTDIGFEQGPSSLRMRLGAPLPTGDPSRVVAIASGAVG